MGVWFVVSIGEIYSRPFGGQLPSLLGVIYSFLKSPTRTQCTLSTVFLQGSPWKTKWPKTTPKRKIKGKRCLETCYYFLMLAVACPVAVVSRVLNYGIYPVQLHLVPIDLKAKNTSQHGIFKRQ
mmetsp:Transcript_12328/g.22334  ORF Transcript_12328/g.22334 Transcript_12328/m.22334 type:complete len:124 (+) Transcript_12328:1059-1430(+)